MFNRENSDSNTDNICVLIKYICISNIDIAIYCEIQVSLFIDRDICIKWLKPQRDGHKFLCFNNGTIIDISTYTEIQISLI